MSILKLTDVRAHFNAERANGVGLSKPTDIRDTLQEKLASFAQSVYDTRMGRLTDSKGHKIPAQDVSMEKAAKAFFGCDLPQLMYGLQIYSNADTLGTVADRFGMANLTVESLTKALVDHGNASFSSVPASTGGVSDTWRFLIPELINTAIRTGYTASAQHPKWIANTMNLTQMSVKMPQILRGNIGVSKVNEGANIPKGSLRFGQKGADVYKVGVGFALTDELILSASLDLVSLFLQEVGNEMALGADWAAMQVLINGEQADGSESAPVIGVLDTSKGFQYGDLKRGFSRMSRLGIAADRVISGEDDGIAITSIDRFEGFQGQTTLAKPSSSVIGVPERFDLDTFPTPPNQVMLLNSKRAMAKLTFRGLLMEEQRNPENQTKEVYVSDYLNFVIIKRDGRVLIDKSVLYSVVGFPGYMNIDARIQSAFLEA